MMKKSTRALLSLQELAPPRFNVADSRMLEYLEKHGYVVVADVVGSSTELNRLEGLLWDFLETNTKGRWRRHDSSSWDREGMLREGESVHSMAGIVGDGIHGVLHGAGIGQSEFTWVF